MRTPNETHLRVMKANLLFVILLGFAVGCTGSPRDVKSPAPSSGLSSRAVIYFSGQFVRTGRFAWTNGMTLKDGIDVAGGFTKWADRTLHLVHGDGSKDLYRLGPGRTLTNNPALQPGDVDIIPGHVDAF